MAAYETLVVWSVMLFLTGAVGQSVIYPFLKACAVEGSTVTLPCTFTPLKSSFKYGREVQLKIVRVLWCQNHPICHGTTPSVFDSKSPNINSRYRYLGDLETNCTLQIRDIQKTDDSTFRFRMEADDPAGHFTNQIGVMVTVVDGVKLRIKVSNQTEFRRGQTVSLQCTSLACTIHQLEVTWFRDNHALPESGHTLQLQNLTAEDSGKYTCSLKTSKTKSDPFSLQVEDDPEDGDSPFLVIALVFSFLLVVIVLGLIFFIKRKRAAAEQQRTMGAETGQKSDDVIYSGILPPGGNNGGVGPKETGAEAQDVSYAAVQFRHQKPSRRVEEVNDVVYSSVVSRG